MRTTEWTWRIFYYFVTILLTAVQNLLCTWSHAYTDCVCIFSKKQCCYTSCYSFTVLFDWHTLWLPLLSLDVFSCLWRSSKQLCCITTAYRCMWCHTPACSRIHTFLSSGEATHWAVSLVRLLSPNHSEHDHATEQLHAHLWQTAGA